MIETAELTADQTIDLEELLREYQDRFSDNPGRTTTVIYDIELTTSQPVRSKVYRVSPHQRSLMEVDIIRMLDLNIIEACESDYTSPLIWLKSRERNQVLVLTTGD